MCATPDALKHPDLDWNENGQSSLKGSMLRVFRRLDELFISWARDAQADEHAFPTFIPARELAKIGYFSSFPHLVSFPVTLEASQENLERFSQGKPIDENGEIHLTRAAPIRDVLTPAACYHFYARFQGTDLDAPLRLTTRATCFRRETHYVPLQRQWSFNMRELVCIGTSEDVKGFVAAQQARIVELVRRLDLGAEWQHATDPFFNPSKNPKYLLQKLDPVKNELIFDGHLAIASLNFHRNYFGEAFKIRVREAGGAAGAAYGDAFSGCVAFGLERWIHALFKRHGDEAEARLEAALAEGPV